MLYFAHLLPCSESWNSLVILSFSTQKMHNVLLFLIYKFVWPSSRPLIEILKHWYTYVYTCIYKKSISRKIKFKKKNRSLDYDSDVLCKSFKEKRNADKCKEVLIEREINFEKKELPYATESRLHAGSLVYFAINAKCWANECMKGFRACSTANSQ